MKKRNGKGKRSAEAKPGDTIMVPFTLPSTGLMNVRSFGGPHPAVKTRIKRRWKPGELAMGLRDGFLLDEAAVKRTKRARTKARRKPVRPKSKGARS
jgi:hypothetical protein